MKTDAEPKKDVEAELDFEPAVNAALIGVIVKDSAVTLTGRVGSYTERWSAEEAAKRVYGVVQNQITIAA